MQYTSTVLDSSVELLFSTTEVIKSGDVWELVGMPQVSRPIYESFKKVLAALGGCWNGKTHLFYRDPTESIQELLKVGKMPKINPYSLFETPDTSVEELLDLIDVHFCDDEFTKQWRILEPSAGRGAIARAIRKRLPLAQIDCLEIDPVNREVLESQGFNVIGEDFLTANLEGDYHFIVMNPPFERDNYIAHITKAYGLLGRAGKLGAIAPYMMLNASTKAAVAFRNLVAERGSLDDIGRPFEFTNVQCVQLKIEQMDDSELQRIWSKTNGYPSWPAYELMLYLENEEEFHELQSEEVRDRDHIGRLVDDLVSGFLRQGLLIYFDDALREWAIDKFIDDIEPAVPADELKAHFDKMNRLAAKAKPAKKSQKHVQVPFFDNDFLSGVEQLELVV